MTLRGVAFLALLCGGVRLSADEFQPAIRAALVANADAMNGLAIEGSQERRVLVDPRYALKEMNEPDSEEEFKQRVGFTLKLHGAQIYVSLRFPKGEYHSGTAVDERSFDGSKLFTGVRYPTGDLFTPGILRIESPNNLKVEDTRRLRDNPALDLPYLSAAGFTGSILASELGGPIRSLVLARLEAGALVGVSEALVNESKLIEVTVSYPDPWASRAQAPLDADLSDIPEAMRDRERFQRELEQMHRQLVGKL